MSSPLPTCPACHSSSVVKNGSIHNGKQNHKCKTCGAYETVLPSQRHRVVGKDSGQTNHIERFNCTLRQRISRLVRKTLSFSKKLENHIGAIWYFIHHYNASLQL